MNPSITIRLASAVAAVLMTLATVHTIAGYALPEAGAPQMAANSTTAK